ncbi:MAG: MBL fold metallo-hydrolase [Deltaproteobacteria bacterium]|nr:MBL fold metallo-hydrolase [Deltaproteobacteria bacterium]
MLIDGGAPAEGVETICPYLDRHRIERIDVMVMTHPDYDHSGGLAEIFDCAEVDAVWVNGDASDTDEGYLAFIAALGEWGGEPFVPELGYFTAFGDATVTVIHTLSEAFDDLNNNSMAMRLDYGDFSMVFGADLHAESQQRVADEAPGTLACGVVRVPSHAGYPFSQDFVDALGAEYALVSVDSTVIPDEYPDQRTLDAYADAGMTVLLTEDTGHMTVRLGGAGEIIVEMPL